MKNWAKAAIEIIFSEKNNYSFKPEAYIIFFGLLISITAAIISDDLLLFGHKSISVFDIWSFSHVTTGMILAAFVLSLRQHSIHHPIILLLLLSSSWEIVEHYLEAINTGIIPDWFAGEESIFNRLVADQVSIVIGFALFKYKPRLFPIALIASTAVLIIHLVVGNSMYFFDL